MNDFWQGFVWGMLTTVSVVTAYILWEVTKVRRALSKMSPSERVRFQKDLAKRSTRRAQEWLGDE